MKAIVLGATGFIGSHIVRALIGEEIDVRILRRKSSPHKALEGLKVQESIGDLDNPISLQKAFKGCQVLFHAAGYYPIYSFEREKQKQIAWRQMKNVLEAAESAGIGKIVYTSSMSTIGRAGAHGRAPLPSNEETFYDSKHFKGLYYQIKYMMEQQALEAAKKGLPITIVNPTGVFGDYDVKPTSGTLVVTIAKRQLPVLMDAKMNAIDVRDVAQGQLAAMKLGKIGRRYILGNHNTTVWELSRLIARLANVRPPRCKVPLWIGELAANISEPLDYYLFKKEKPSVPKVGIDFLRYGMHYDTARAQTELGLKSTPLEETFERALGWFRSHNYL